MLPHLLFHPNPIHVVLRVLVQLLLFGALCTYREVRKDFLCPSSHILFAGECVSSGKSNLDQHRMLGTGHTQHPLLQWLTVGPPHSSQVLCLHSSSETEVISSQAWQLDFPGDLYKPEVSWEVSQLHHPAFGVYSYSN